VAAELSVVLFAVRRESLFFRRALRPYAPVAGCPCWARLCGVPQRPVLLLETGVGLANVARALAWLFGASPRPARLLFAGFAGALTAELRVGDVLWATDVLDAAGHARPTTWPGPVPPHLPSGCLLTMPRLIGAPAEKRLLGQLHGARAVDMESAYFARRCAEHNIPFGCIRAISDDVDTALSLELINLLQQGVVSPWRCGAAVLRRPRLLREMLRLARHTALASRRLGSALEELLSPA
jgi:adenosylhomocysteine nucleosidase